MHGFERALDGRGAQVDHVAVGDEGGHKFELVDVKVAEALSEGKGGLAAFVCELAGLAYGVEFVAGTGGDYCWFYQLLCMIMWVSVRFLCK